MHVTHVVHLPLSGSLLDLTKHYTKFLSNAGLNTDFNLKNKVTLEFGIIFNVMLIVSTKAEFNVKQPNFSCMPKLI